MTLSPGPTVALVPLRSPGHGKTRLADVLDRDERAALSAAMLADVVAALRASPVDRIVVAAGGRGAAGAARDLPAASGHAAGRHGRPAPAAVHRRRGRCWPSGRRCWWRPPPTGAPAGCCGGPPT